MEDEIKNPGLTDEETKLFETLMPEDLNEISAFGVQRRHFLKLLALTGGGMFLFQMMDRHQIFAHPPNEAALNGMKAVSIENGVNVAFKINGARRSLEVDSRMTLLDALRERLELTGSKKAAIMDNAVPVQFLLMAGGYYPVLHLRQPARANQ